VLIAVDVGNTQTHIGAYEGSELVAESRFATEADATYDELALLISGLPQMDEIRLDQIEGSITATVVPELGPAYAEMFRRHGAGRCLEVGPGLETGMPIRVENRDQLGADRLANAVGAFDRVSGPCVAVDFGTSTNFDAVSAEGEYLGGAIGPGLEVSIEALIRRTAKLPQIELAEPGAAIGRNTQAAMESGFVYGFAGLVDGLARRLDAELEGDATFIATGGLAPVVTPYCETIDEVDQLLTLTGLRLLWELNK
jgi:type III pantothenate kinase